MTDKSGSIKKTSSSGNGISFKNLEDSAAHTAEVTSASSPEKKDLSFKAIEKTPASSISDGPGRTADEKKDLAFRKIEGQYVPERPDVCRHVKELFNGAKESLFNVFQLIKEGRDFSVEPLVPYAKNFASCMQKDSNPWILLIYKGVKDDNVVIQLVIHSLNTAIIAVRIGIGLKMIDEELEALAMLTFLQDVGMLMVSPEIIKKPGKLTSAELALMKKHTEQGYNILKGLKELKARYGDIAQSAYQTHERRDGSGYPNGLKNDEILNNASIVGISDIYAATLQVRPFRDRYLPFDAIKHIIMTSKEKFPRSILKVLVNEFSGFPLGSYVKLNSKEIAKVISVNRLAPLRPVIEIVFDVYGQKIHEPRTVDLMKDHVLQIKAACFPDEIDELQSLGKNE